MSTMQRGELTPIISIRLVLIPTNAAIGDTWNISSPGTNLPSRKGIQE